MGGRLLPSYDVCPFVCLSGVTLMYPGHTAYGLLRINADNLYYENLLNLAISLCIGLHYVVSVITLIYFPLLNLLRHCDVTVCQVISCLESSSSTVSSTFHRPSYIGRPAGKTEYLNLSYSVQCTLVFANLPHPNFKTNHNSNTLKYCNSGVLLVNLTLSPKARAERRK